MGEGAGLHPGAVELLVTVEGVEEVVGAEEEEALGPLQKPPLHVLNAH